MNTQLHLYIGNDRVIVGGKLARVKLIMQSVTSAILIILSTSIVWHLLTAEFPTHSDVFWIGVQSGALSILSILFFIFGLFLLYRIATKRS